jgi:uncharacterized protein YyaL (SSP411 family)
LRFFIIFLLFFNFLFANHLQNSDSEYLLEHADNPVDWYPWNKEAFQKAIKENKLIFLSIGYSTCHWCHVMLKESFTDKTVAKILNENYISIKVDKEEHPEIDRYYQWVYKKLYNKTAGWPLNIILLPNKKIVFISTYIPKKDIFAKKGLLTILPYYAKIWRENPKKLIKLSHDIEKKLTQKYQIKKYNNPLKIIEGEIDKNFDFNYGGFKGLHKFPEYSKLMLLLDVYLLSKKEKYLKMFNLTLLNMAKSGMYDQVEGGFFRYSVYDDFSIPHFEKMLYTNALMIDLYSTAYKYTKNPLYKKVIIETINEFNKKYLSKEGLYYAANSADSPNEGDYFTFSKQEIYQALKNIPNKKEILKYINFDEEGNFEKNKNHIYFNFDTPKPKRLEKFLDNLKNIRKTHSYPFIDKKKMLSWNAMMVSAFYKASIVDKKYITKATDLLNKILTTFYKNGILYHGYVHKITKKADLEDYAYLIRALIDAYEYTGNIKYLKNAEIFIKKSINFKKNNWILSNNFPATIEEKSYPSALSVLFNNFIDYASLTNDFDLFEFVSNELKKYPISLNYANLTIAKLKLKYNEYILKSKNVKITYPIMFPFYLWKYTEYDFYQICTIFACLLKTKDFNAVKNFFEKIKY